VSYHLETTATATTAWPGLYSLGATARGMPAGPYRCVAGEEGRVTTQLGNWSSRSCVVGSSYARVTQTHVCTSIYLYLSHLLSLRSNLPAPGPTPARQTFWCRVVSRRIISITRSRQRYVRPTARLRPKHLPPTSQATHQPAQPAQPSQLSPASVPAQIQAPAHQREKGPKSWPPTALAAGRDAARPTPSVPLP
jgi:hypothetical protein